MESHHNAVVKLTIKNDMAFNFIFSTMMTKILEIQGHQVEKDNDTLMKFIRAFPNGRIIVKSIEKFFEDAKDAVKENRISIAPEFPEEMKTGGIIEIYMRGSPQEIEEWTKIRLVDKIFMRGAKFLIDVKVEK